MSALPGLQHGRAAVIENEEQGRNAMPTSDARESAPRFCWVDLATFDEGAAKSFYSRLFGWALSDRRVAEGRFGCFEQNGAPFASLYQLTRRQMAQGVPSHWTPYVSVPNVDMAASEAAGLGAQIIVPPHNSGGLARISLVCDPTGALIGLWQDLRETGYDR